MSWRYADEKPQLDELRKKAAPNDKTGDGSLSCIQFIRLNVYF